MRFWILGSGSKGNAALLDAAGVRVLIDAGVSLKLLRERAESIGVVLDGIDAIVLTHAHGDHVGYTKAYARAFGCPVYMTEATHRRVRVAAGTSTRVFGADAPFSIGALAVKPCSVPHDAPQVALVFDDGENRAALVTDLGHVPLHLRDHLQGVSTLLLESNYDASMLMSGPYPAWLKSRVAGRLGHLDNVQTAELLTALAPQLRTVALMHISDTNNTPELARARARAALASHEVDLMVSAQCTPMIIDVAGSSSLARGIAPQITRSSADLNIL